MNPPQVCTCSPSWTPPPISLPIPSLWVVPLHQPQASSIIHRTWTGDSFHIWYFTCFTAILPNHPTLSLSHRVQKSVLYMEFRKMVMITLYARQQKRHRGIEQSFGLCGKRRGWDDLGEWHWNIYNIIYEMNCQSKFDAWYWMLGAEGWYGEGDGRWGSGWGTRAYLWRIHVDVWQNKYNIVK